MSQTKDYYNKELRHLYNKEYYEQHKLEILNKLSEKATCEFCLRSVKRCNLINHQKTDICKRKAAIIKNNELRKQSLLNSN